MKNPQIRDKIQKLEKEAIKWRERTLSILPIASAYILGTQLDEPNNFISLGILGSLMTYGICAWGSYSSARDQLRGFYRHCRDRED